MSPQINRHYDEEGAIESVLLEEYEETVKHSIKYTLSVKQINPTDANTSISIHLDYKGSVPKQFTFSSKLLKELIFLLSETEKKITSNSGQIDLKEGA